LEVPSAKMGMKKPEEPTQKESRTKGIHRHAKRRMEKEGYDFGRKRPPYEEKTSKGERYPFV